MTVALSGQGADELLGGYRKHRAAAIAGTWSRFRPVRARGGCGLRSAPSRFGRAVADAERGRPGRAAARSERQDQPGAAAGSRPRAARRAGRERRPAAVAQRLGSVGDDPLPAALYLDANSASSTTCSTTSTARRWRTRWRCAFRSSTTTSSSTARRSRRATRCGASTRSTCSSAPSAASFPDRIIDKPKIGFFHTAVDGWFRAQTRGAISDYLLGPEPALRRDARPRPRRAARQGATRAGTDTGTLASCCRS